MASRTDRTAPGGPEVSDAKRRRLAALESTLATTVAKQVGQRGKKKQDRGDDQQPRKWQKSAAARGPRPASDAAEPCVPPYDVLCSSIQENILSRTPQQGGARAQGDTVENLLESLMLTNPRAASSRAVIGLRVQDKNVLLDNPYAPLKKAQRQQDSLTSQLLSGVQLKRLGLNNLPTEGIRYSHMAPVHKLWQRYVRDLLASGQGSEEHLLMQMELRGSHIRVAQHGDGRLVGLEGIVLKYNDAVFHVVTPANRLARVPRFHGCEVQIRVDAQRMVSLRQ